VLTDLIPGPDKVYRPVALRRSQQRRGRACCAAWVSGWVASPDSRKKSSSERHSAL